MSYVHKLIEKDEELIGIATLHWIYVLKGLGWFFGMGAIGWAFDALLTRGIMALASFSNTGAVPASLMGISNWVMMFCLVVGFILFALYVIKVISTHIALTNRRIIHKWGLIMVKVEQIDLEEVRGENLDLGWFGRFLGYAYVDLDCRFIGDVKLDAIESPERFIRALHHQRANTQDALNVMLGKGNTVMPMNIATQAEGNQQPFADDPNKQQPQNPQPETPQPPARPEIEPQPTQPEIQPPQTPTEIPAPPNEPMPTQPPPLSQDQQAGEQARKHDTPHNDRQKMIDQEEAPAEVPRTKGQVQQKAQVHQQAAQVVEQVKEKISAPAQGSSGIDHVSPEIVEQVVQEVTPKIAQEVVRQMEEQGLMSHNDNKQPAGDITVDNDLIHDFDDAALTKDGKHNDPDNKDRLGYTIN